MIHTEAVRDRIEAKIPDLAGRIKFAAEWAKVIETGQMPQSDFAGFVLPGLLSAGNANASAGAFTQALQETVLVVLCRRVTDDPTGGKAIDAIRPFAAAAIRAIAGWEPPVAEGESSPVGVFEFAQGELVGAVDGTLVLELHFRLNDQLRIFE